MGALGALALLAAAGCPAPAEQPPGRKDAAANADGSAREDGGGSAARPAIFEYVEVAGAVCANGTPVGIGVSAGSAGSTLAVLINGGGACWDSWTCFGLNAAAHLSDTYSAQVMQNDLAPVLAAGLFDRNAPDNPLTSADLAFVPYCTGDLHDGDADRQLQADLIGADIRTVHHRGRPNAAAFATALAARFSDVSEVFLIGISAGGYGAVLDHDLYASAFSPRPVHVLADGSPFVPPQNGLYFTWQSQWNMQLPGCADCATSFGAVVEHVRASHPGMRFALITSTNDETIRSYFGYGLNDMTAQVNALVDASYTHTNGRAFVVAGTQHVLLGGYRTLVEPGGRSLKSWVDAFVAGSADWTLVRP